VDLASARTGGAVALKSAGTLWRLSRNTAPSQIGSDTGWKKVVAGPSFFLALKQDGTIWGWGDNESEILAKRQVKDDRNRRFSNPVQVWPNSDWADVFEPVFGRAIAVKRDGSLWSWGNGGMNVNRPDPNNPSFHQLVRMSITGTNWSSILDLNNLGLGIGADGRLMLWAVGGNPGFVQERAASRLFGSPIPWDGVVQPVQLGEKTDWMNLCLGGIQVLALEADGSFWAIDRSTIKARQPSKHHDWLAVSGDAQTIWALARDGTVVCWSDFSRENPYDEDKDHWIQLRPSRRPLADINILDSK
jgi:alpha-tubulin suppressor-like RCC1 family protein